MRKIKLFIASSLDGYIAREDGSIDWLFTDGDYGFSQFYESIDTIIMGRKTYEQILKSGEYPHKDKKSYVLSQNPKVKRKGQHVEFIYADVMDFIRKNLIQSQDKDIWLVGGSDIISIFLNANLVDEIILSIHPIVIAKGIPLFKNVQKQVNMKLLESIPYENGLMQLHYELHHQQH
ncbi:MAG TPA: dihydrofolate reductase family protein [Nitrososphaeraceae archaeon]